MLSLANVTLLLAVVVTTAIFYAVVTYPLLRKHSVGARKYRLFAIRDSLIRLVAEGKLSEESLAFRRYYDLINFLVNNTDHLTLSTLIRALMAAKEKGLEPNPENGEIKIEIERNKDLARWLESFFMELMSIIRDNSLVLRLLLACRRFLPKRRETLSRLPAVQRKAIEFYRHYRSASARLSSAAA